MRFVKPSNFLAVELPGNLVDRVLDALAVEVERAEAWGSEWIQAVEKRPDAVEALKARIESAVLSWFDDYAECRPDKIKAGLVAPYPEKWPKCYNGCTDPCDALQGPCACGAWHTAEDWETPGKLRSGIVLGSKKGQESC